MTQYMLILFSALLVAVGIMPLVRKAAVRWGFVDQPSERKVHTAPTPRSPDTPPGWRSHLSGMHRCSAPLR